MSHPREYAVAALVAAAVSGCGDNGSAWAPYVADVTIAAGATRLTLAGGEFERGAVAAWNGVTQRTTFVSPRALTVDLDAGLTDAVGDATVTVTNPEVFPSNPANVHVRELLTFAGCAPPALPLGGGDATLLGSGFMRGATVTWNGAPVAATYVSRSQLVLHVAAGQADAIGEARVRVQNPQLHPEQVSGVAEAPCVVGEGHASRRAGAPDVVDISDVAGGLLYVVARRFTGADALEALDPATGERVALAPVASPRAVAASADAVYVAFSGDGDRIARYPLPWSASAVPLEWTAPRAVRHLSPAPGAPGLLAAVDDGGLSIFRDGVLLPKRILGVESIAWGADATLLLASSPTGAIVATVDATGAAAATVTAAGFGAAARFDPGSRLFYADSGAILDERGTAVGAFDLAADLGADGLACAAALHAAAGKIFFACSRGSGPFSSDLVSIRSFDLATRAPLGAFPVVGRGQPLRLVRWGADGLALVSSSGEVKLISGPFVR